MPKELCTTNGINYMLKKYRNKEIIEAMQITEQFVNQSIPWEKPIIEIVESEFPDKDWLVRLDTGRAFSTLMHLRNGDYIVKRGDDYLPYKRSDFEKIYEEEL